MRLEGVMQVELDPCPICGGTIGIAYETYETYADCYLFNIRCKNCLDKGIHAGDWCSIKDAIKRYNDEILQFALPCHCGLRPIIEHYERKSCNTPEPYTKISCPKCKVPCKFELVVKRTTQGKVKKRFLDTVKNWNDLMKIIPPIATKHKCRDCAHFISTLKTQGCGLDYPPAKCSGNLTIECEDFITPEAEEARQKKLWSNPSQEKRCEK